MQNDNVIVNGLWIGNTLSMIEQLTVCSFIDHGHEFHLWTYQELETELPVEVIIRDANQIIPENQVFKYKKTNQFGHGKGSYAGFSDLFRYKLLHENGGWWVDMDVCCLKPLDFKDPYVFRTHHHLPAVGNIMKCPKGNQMMKRCYEEALVSVDENNTNWHKPLEILNDNIQKFGLEIFITEISNQDQWGDIKSLVYKKSVPNPEWFAIHWANENWRANGVKKDVFKKKSTISMLLEKHGLNHKKLSLSDTLFQEITLSNFYTKLSKVKSRLSG